MLSNFIPVVKVQNDFHIVDLCLIIRLPPQLSQQHKRICRKLVADSSFILLCGKRWTEQGGVNSA